LRAGLRIVNHQILDVGDRGAVGFVGAHEDVDLPVALAEARGDVSPDLVAQHIRDLTFLETQSGQPRTVEANLNLRIAQLRRALDVGQAADPFHALHDKVGGCALLFEIEGVNFHLDRRLEAEERRPAEGVRHFRKPVQLGADLPDGLFLGRLIAAVFITT
jgi:hypothetical protein